MIMRGSKRGLMRKGILSSSEDQLRTRIPQRETLTVDGDVMRERTRTVPDFEYAAGGHRRLASIEETSVPVTRQ
jgi:hypothetical protein